MSTNKRKKIVVGETMFGDLRIIERLGMDNDGQYTYKLLCTCGSVLLLNGRVLKKYETCGCYGNGIPPRTYVIYDNKHNLLKVTNREPSLSIRAGNFGNEIIFESDLNIKSVIKEELRDYKELGLSGFVYNIKKEDAAKIVNAVSNQVKELSN